MGAKARKIQTEHLKNLPENKRLFPINAGVGWVGSIVRHDPGLIVLKNPRPLHAAPPGWPDLCGLETIEITPEMVGRKIGVFVAEEIKADGDRLTPPQKRFQEIVEKMGGVYRIVRG